MRLGRASWGILKTSSIKKPKKIINILPNRLNQILYGASTVAPTKPISVPEIMNTMLKPITKNKPFKKILRRVLSGVVMLFKLLSGTPLINARYPGTKGRVQGARNVSRPATKDEKIKEASIINKL